MCNARWGLWAKDCYKMKLVKLCLSLVVGILVVQSCTSPKEKALQLVRSHVKENLYKPESYKELNATVDSVFSVDGTLNAHLAWWEVVYLIPETKEMIGELEENKSDMSYWGDEYSWSYGRQQYFEAKAKYDALEKKIDVNKQKIKERMEFFIEDRFSDQERSFVGYLVEIGYSAKNLSGQEIPGHGVYYVDSEARGIVYEKDFNLMELFEVSIQKEKPLSSKIVEYVDDFCSGGGVFDVDDFIAYVSL